MTARKDRTRLTLRDETNPGTRRQLWATVDPRGNLIMSGRDVGPATALYSTKGSFAWTRTIGAGSIPQLLGALGVAENADILDEIRKHWTREHSYELERRILDSLPECSYVDIDYGTQFIADGVSVDPASRKLNGRDWELQAKWVRADANGGLKALLPVREGLNLFVSGGRSTIPRRLLSASRMQGGSTGCKFPDFVSKGTRLPALPWLHVEAWTGAPEDYTTGEDSDGVAVLGRDGVARALAVIPLCDCGVRGCGNSGVQMVNDIPPHDLADLVQILRRLPWTNREWSAADVLQGQGLAGRHSYFTVLTPRGLELWPNPDHQ